MDSMPEMDGFPTLGAVITGDIIGSTRYTAEQRLQIRKVLLRCGEMQHLPYPVQVFQGDSWQLYITKPAGVLRTAVLMRAGLLALLPGMKVLSRMSLAVGMVDSAGESGDGEAYILSGRNLEKITRKSPSKMVITLGESFRLPVVQVESIQVILTGLDFITSRWTYLQAYAIMQVILGEEVDSIGSSWPAGPISKRAVDQHLQRAGWNAISSAIQYFETTIQSFLEK